MAESKKKCRQYSVDYLKFGFIPSLLDKALPMLPFMQQSFKQRR